MNKVKVISEHHVIGVPKACANEFVVSLDDWRPSKTPAKRIIPSEWRARQNNGKGGQIPSLDDIRKIKSYLNKGIRISEIASIFHVSKRIVIEISENRYRQFGQQG